MRLASVIACLAAVSAFRARPRAPSARPRAAPVRGAAAARQPERVSLSSSITSAFPVLVTGSAVLGATRLGPLVFRMDAAQVTAALAATMLAMGTTLTPEDFARVARRPRPVGVGFAAQFCIMPAAAAVAARLWRLEGGLAAGVCLVGCCPGGVASNLVALIARADVPLSISMTTCSTIAACALTPVLAALSAGTSAAVNRAALAASTVQVVLGPVAAGLALRSVAPGACRRAQAALAPIATLLVAAICGSVVAGGPATAVSRGAVAATLGAVATLHAIGFGLGYAAAAAGGLDEAARRTVSIETGMQNSALAVVLAGAAGLGDAAKLPGAISATTHSVMGSFLARRWRARPPVPPRHVAVAFERYAWSGPVFAK